MRYLRSSLCFVGALSILLSLVACDSNPDPAELTAASSSSPQLRLSEGGAKHRVIGSRGSEGFFVRLSAVSEWSIALEPEQAKEWILLDENMGRAHHDYSVRVQVSDNGGQEREALLILLATGLSDTITITQQGMVAPTTPVPAPELDPQPIPEEPNPSPLPDPTPPTIPTGEVIMGDVKRLEVPRLAGGAHNYFVSHYTEDNTLNYSLEYDTERRHARWVAFRFDGKTSEQKVKRSDAWSWDAKIPSQYSTDNWFSKTGYSRGHLVASSDRLYSRQANAQTFFYSNMSPQLQSHNGGIWQQLEALVQSWGRNAGFRDALYVAKGGTIRDGQIESRRIRNKMVVPKYYWMAILREKAGAYEAIAFWTEHREYSKSTALRTLVISVDELEQRTGLDFFPNLADDVEAKVEASLPDNHLWPGL